MMSQSSMFANEPQELTVLSDIIIYSKHLAYNFSNIFDLSK